LVRGKCSIECRILKVILYPVAMKHVPHKLAGNFRRWNHRLLGMFALTVLVLSMMFMYSSMQYYCPMQHVLGTVDGIDINLEDILLSHLARTSENDKSSSIEIPKVIYQTYKHKHKIPAKVAANVAKFAPDYERAIFDDQECLDFLKDFYHPAVATTFHYLGGAHKADLFRYAILYLMGGVYLDIKTELLVPLEVIFPPKGDRRVTYTSLIASDILSGHSIYQGVVATPKGNPMFLYLIHQFVQAQKPIKNYFLSTNKMYELACKETNQKLLHDGLNVAPGDGLHSNIDVGNGTNKHFKFDYFLLQEKKRPVSECYDGVDRHGGCEFIYKGDQKVIKTRYADYPWNEKPIRKFPVLIDTSKIMGMLCRAAGWKPFVVKQQY
jgi:Glycosyltransferase sugar-binding region containing DXD motif